MPAVMVENRSLGKIRFVFVHLLYVIDKVILIDLFITSYNIQHWFKVNFYCL